MRRDYFTTDLRNADPDGPDRPAVGLAFDGPSELLADRLETADGQHLDESEVDVAFRYTTDVESDDATGVFSVTNRLTGEFLLETNVDAALVGRLITAARSDEADDDEWRYRVVIEQDDETLATFHKRTLLVYDGDGDLRREKSLIPGGVEL